MRAILALLRTQFLPSTALVPSIAQFPSTVLLLLALLLLPTATLAEVTDPRLVLHASTGAPSCQVAIDCWDVATSVEPGPVTVYLLFNNSIEFGGEPGMVSGLQTAFDWDDWTLVSSWWFCMSGQIPWAVPTGSGPDLGTLRITFDPIVDGVTTVVGWLEMNAVAGSLRQVESNAPDGTHVLDGLAQATPVPPLARGEVRVDGPGRATCDYGCSDPFVQSCDANPWGDPDVYVVGSNPSEPLLVDLNGDTHVDIVATVDGYVTVMPGDGAGGFADPLTGASNLGSLHVEDRNGDDILDLVGLDLEDGAIAVLTGAGDGTFGTPVHHPTVMTRARYVDLNDDSIDDVVGTVRLAGFAHDLVVMLGQPGGGFAPETQLSFGSYIPELRVAQLDDDDFGDLAMLVYGGEGEDDRVVVLAGNGNGTFDLNTPLAEVATLYQRGLSVADYTGDGTLDVGFVVYIESWGPTWGQVLVGQGDGTFTLSDLSGIGACSSFAGGWDVDGDGFVDAVSTGGGNCTSHAFCGFEAGFEIMAGDGTGDFGFPRLARCSFGLGRSARLNAAHLDGDEQIDLIVAADPTFLVYHSAEPTSVVEQPAPARRTFLRAAPNPFRTSTRVEFVLEFAARTKAEVFDATGRHVRTLAAGVPLTAGRQIFEWDGRDEAGRRVAGGVYMVEIDAGGRAWSEKLLVLR